MSAIHWQMVVHFVKNCESKMRSGVREKLLARNERGVVVYCHHGVRSLRATHFLRSIGVANAFSMKGGIEEWAERIDPEMPRY